MERKKLVKNEQIAEGFKNIASKNLGLTSALAACNFYGVFWEKHTELMQVLKREYRKELWQLTTLEEFWSPALKKSLTTLVGTDYTNTIYEVIKIRLEGQFSLSIWRHSYHSADVGYYADSLIDLVLQSILTFSYTTSVEEMLYYDHDYPRAYKYLLAYEIRKNNKSIIEKIHEAIMGDNSEIVITRSIIEAIIISNNNALMEDLLKLLLAARLQEGLRQQILESADIGSTQALKRILKLCIDENMFRYSSTIRAFDTWTGLGYGDEKPANVVKCAEYAYACLDSEDTRKEYLDSENAQKAYFALWAMGCYEIRDTEVMTQKLLSDNQKYKQILGWLFITHSDSEAYRMTFASKFLHERDEEILAWVTRNLSITPKHLGCYHASGTPYKNEAYKNEHFPNSKHERQELFAQLKDVAEFIGDKSRTFSGTPFDFVGVTLENTRVISCLLSVAGYDMDLNLINQLSEIHHLMNSDQRRAFIINFLNPEKHEEHKNFLKEALNDRSVYVKEAAVERLSVCKLNNEDLTTLAESLRSKSSSFRKAVLSVFSKQATDGLKFIIGKMLTASEEYQIQAAIELLLELKEKNPKIISEFTKELENLKQQKISTQTQILLDRLTSENESIEEYNVLNGYGIYKPETIAIFTSQIAPLSFPTKKVGFFSKLLGKQETSEDLLTANEINAFLPVWRNLDEVLEKINQVFEKHKDYEYEVDSWNGRTKVLFGDTEYRIQLPYKYGIRYLSDEKALFEMIPFYEEFLEAMGDYVTDPKKYMGLRYITTSHYIDSFDSTFDYASWYLPFVQMNLAPSYHNAGREKYGNRYSALLSIIAKAHQKMDSHALFTIAIKLYLSLINIYGEANLTREYLERNKKATSRYTYHSTISNPILINCRALSCMRYIINDLELNSEDFKTWFLQAFRIEKISSKVVSGCLRLTDYFKACNEGYVPKDALFQFLIFTNEQIPINIKYLTNPNRRPESRELFNQYPWAADVAKTLVEQILKVEERRGELTTDLTHASMCIERFEGAKHFCNLLAALGKESFFRGYEFSHDTTKKAVLSRLLKRCYPSSTDTPEYLAELLKATDISENRLAEAVMYAPQWADFAEKILGWNGLKCGVWFFHAHINETFSAEKETEVAIYSPISPQQFNDGAFDKNWFFEAYEKLGEKRFQTLYKSAKYITTGSNQHRRSQLYSDAVLGKLDANELLKEIKDKRNQEKLRCYPLIPIAPDDKNEALHRYEFLQEFLKGSKQFGAQRRESEKKAYSTAMENLAITTGLMDVNRLMWQMESKKFNEILPYTSPTTIEDISIKLDIDSDGNASIITEKNGKVLKTTPKAFAKNEYFLTLKGILKELKEQKQRAKESLERAMTDSTTFGASELINILSNMIIAPMVEKLIWTDDTDCGFLKKNGQKLSLSLLSGVEKDITSSNIRIAHPYDMQKVNQWAEYMHFLYENKIVQPFKQVFREYYPITEDERKERLVSRRYEGHQVQPRKTVALLKSRGWTIDYEEGLQKVFYKENLIVRMYAMADWFSPADIEVPTIETISFYDRSTGEAIELEKIPPVIFSETMRDIDLVVSVAHIGGVDPETSHSTIEMRIAIATELIKLLKLSNVNWYSAHAKIQGKLANYSVHMGSGVVHAEGKGMIYILPVHSQSRGRIFLPFADDDPKTAEIMSKIILLAEDSKLKDPSILDQIF